MKRFVLLIILLVLNPINAMEVKNSKDNEIEILFTKMQTVRGDCSDAEYFDIFVQTQI